MGGVSAKPLFWCAPSRVEGEEQRRASGRASAVSNTRASTRGSYACEENDAYAPFEEEEEDPRETAREWLKCQELLGPCTCDLHEELLKADEEWMIDLRCEEMMNDEDLCLSTDYFNYLMRSVEHLFPQVEPPVPWTGFAEKLRECYAAHAGERVDRRGRGGPQECREVAQMYQRFVCSDFSRRIDLHRKGQQRAERSASRSQEMSSCGLPLAPRFDGGYD